MCQKSFGNIVSNTKVEGFLIAKKHVYKPHKGEIIIVLALSLPK